MNSENSGNKTLDFSNSKDIPPVKSSERLAKKKTLAFANPTHNTNSVTNNSTILHTISKTIPKNIVSFI